MAVFHTTLLWISSILTISLTYAAPHVLQSQAVKGDLLLKNIFISNPFEADPTSSYNSTLSMMVSDEDYPGAAPVHCLIEWKAGVRPPQSTGYQCENNTVRAWFPEGTFRGVQDFRLELAHSVIDTAIGSCPEYCYATKFAAVNITFPETPRYDCDTKNATCQQFVNTTIKAPVYLVIS